MASHNRFGRLALAATLSILTCTQLTVRTVCAQGAPDTTPPPQPVTTPAPELAPLTDGATVTSGTQVIDVSQLATPGVFSFDGNLHNTGELFLISTNSSITSAILSAANIVNFGTISTSLPQSLAVPGALSSLNLVLSATSPTGVIWNAGVISSSASLTMNAQTIVNALPVGVTGPTPIMQAMGNLNINGLAAAVNAGTMQSINGNFNINTASQIAQSISFNNTNGLVEALNGSINFRDSSFGDIKESLNILGGEFLTQEMTLHSGTGTINALINNSDGQINLFAGEIYLRQTSGSLSLGNMIAKGDPWIGVDGILDIGRNNEGDPVTSIELTQQYAPVFFSAAKIRNSGLGSITTNGGAVGFRTDFELDLASDGVPLQIKTNGGVFRIIEAGNISFAEGTVIDTSGHAADAIAEQNDIYIRATGSIDAPNLKITTGGGDVSIFGGAGYVPGPPFTLRDDFCCSITMSGAEISTKGSGANDGRVSIGALSGSILMPGSKIEAGNADVRIAAASSIETGDIKASGAAVEITSGTRIYWSIVNGLFDFGTADERNFGGNLTTGTIDTSNITGIGGNITLISLQGDLTAADLTSNGGTIALQAYGDLTGTTITTSSSDSGGVVTVDSGHSITISDIFANGREGGSVFLAGNIHGEEPSFELETSISARGTEHGGLVSVTSSTDLSADTSLIDIGTSSGKGGTLGFAAGGNLTVTGELSAKSDDGDGGAVYLSAGTNMTLPAIVDVSGTGDGRGGDVVIFTSQGEFTSSIFATGTSGGGNINIYGSGDLTLNSSNWDISTTAGFGGTVLVEAGGNLSVQGDLRAVSQSGSGGVVSLTSQAAINVSGIIDVSATSSGTGGQVYIMSAQQGQLPSTIHATGVDGGGRIEIVSGGDLVVDAQNLNVNTVTGTGGTLSLTAGGELVVAGAIAALSQNGDGGSIILSSGGSMSLPSLVNASATAQGTGGSVSITTGGTTINASGSVSVRADGAGTGKGGSVEVTFRTSGSTAESSLFARSGTEGGDGGAISLSSQQGDLLVDPHDWNISIRGDAGNGGALELSSKDGQILLAEGSVSANGKGSGSGGSITLSATGSGSAINIGTGVKLRANGASGGSIKLNSGGDLTVGVDGLRANAIQQDGNGGFISVNGGKVTLNGIFQANGRGTGNGGSIVITSTGTDDGGGGGVIIGLAAFSGPPEEPFETSAAGEPETIEASQSFQANAGTVGYGGLISIHSGSGSIQLGGGSTLASFLANGGTQEGDGGNIHISSASDLSITANQLSASARGNGNGGGIQLSSDGATMVNGTLAATGKGVGDGGSIVIASQSALEVPGSLRADATDNGTGGSVTLSAGSTISTGSASDENTITARGGLLSGNGGLIRMDALENLSANTKSITTASRGATGDGGEIQLNSFGDIHTTAMLDARALSDSGNGGKVKVNAPDRIIIIDGTIDVSAKGEGNGGDVSFDPMELRVNRPINGNGGLFGNGGRLATMGIPEEAGSIYFQDVSFKGGVLGGNGGVLELRSTDGPIKIGDTNVSASAGNAGHVRLFSKTSIEAGSIKVDAKVGNAGFMHLEAGGNISTKTLTATAPAGQAGAVVVHANKDGTGNTPFVIGGNGGSNGINGNVIVTGKTTGTTTEDVPGLVSIRSFIAVIDGGTGGMTVARQNSLSTAATADKGGFIFLSAAKGNLNLGKGLSTDSNTSFAPGSIYLDAQQIQCTGKATISASNTAGTGSAGTISIAASAINYGTQLDLKANGKTGGLIRLGAAGAITYSIEDHPLETTLNIEFGDKIIHDLNIVGAGAFSASSNGVDGGGRMVISARNLNYGSAKAMTLSALGGTDAPGGKIELTASSVLNPNARISLYVDGEGTGRGGTLEVVTLESLKIDNKLSGALYLSAKGGDSGSAGAINVLTRDRLDVNGSGINLESGANGNGGTLNLKSLNSTLAVSNEFLIEGNGTGKGGEIDLQGKVVVVGPTFTFISANSGLQGDGGLIEVTANEVVNLGNSLVVALSGTHSGAQGGVIQITAPEIIQTGGEINTSSRGSSDPGTIVINSTQGALTATLDGDIISTSTDNRLGSINFFAPAETIEVSGSANIQGEINAIGSNVDISTGRQGAVLSLRNLSAAENVRVSASGANSRIDVLPSTQNKPTSVAALSGEVFLQADQLQIGISPDKLSDSNAVVINAPSINLHARAGDIVLGANIEASANATLIARDDITQAGQYTIRTAADGLLSLQTDRGDVFSDAQGTQGLLRIDAGNLSVNAGGFARVYNNGEALHLRDASTGTHLEVRSVGVLTVSGSIRTFGGELKLVSEQGNVEVEPGSVLSARGPITLQAEFGRNSVLLGANSRMETSAGNNIRILLSTVSVVRPARAEDFPLQNNIAHFESGGTVQVSDVSGADRIIGTTIDSAEGFPLGNKLDAIGGNIILDQSVGTGLIRFLGNVTVSAGTLVASSSEQNTDSDNHIVPVSFVNWRSTEGLVRARSETAILTARKGCNLLEQQSGLLLLESGEVIVEAVRDTQLQCGNEFCRIGKGSIVLISKTPHMTRMVNLFDARRNSISVSIDGNRVALPSGREFLVHAPGTVVERVARRDSRETTTSGGRVLRDSEVSLPYVLTRHVILRGVLSSSLPEDQKVSSNIRKMAACLSILKGSHGPFQSGD